MTHCGVFSHMKLRHQVGLNIQKLRRERGISQEDLALMAKVNRGYMGKLENAKNSASLDMVERIATALNVVPSWLLVCRSTLIKEKLPLLAYFGDFCTSI